MNASTSGPSTPGVSIMRFSAMIVGWYLATLVSNMSGKTYVKETLDAMSPTTVSMACAGIVLAAKQCCKSSSHKEDMHGPNRHRQTNKQMWTYHRWAIGLGLIQFLATALSYSSFALSSVTWTYCFRTLEPLISAVLQFFVAGAMTSAKELGALIVLATGIVITVNSNSGGQTYAAWLGALALSATVIYSCRSVIGSRVMKQYGRTGADLFILASTYGCGFSLWLHVSLHTLGFGGAVTFTSVRVRQLLVAGGFHCLYNMMSFQILHILQPVAHGVCNTMKRVFMVVMSALLSGQMLSGVQLFGVMVANAAAGLYGFESKKRAQLEKEQPGSGHEEVCLSDGSAQLGSHHVEVLSVNDDHNIHSSRNVQARLESRLVGVGFVATVIGIMFLFASLHELELRSYVTNAPEISEDTEGVAISTNEIKSWQSQNALQDNLHRHHDSLRLNCIKDVQERIQESITPILQNFGNSIAYLEFADMPKGFGVNLLGALRAVSALGKEIDSICISSHGPNDLEGNLRCKGTSFLNKSEGPQIVLGSGSVWGSNNKKTHNFRLGFLNSLNGSENSLHHILQLPNSLSYEGSSMSVYEQQILEGVQNFYFLSRDHIDVEEANSVFTNKVDIHQSPDVGFQAGPLNPTKLAAVDVGLLLTSKILNDDDLNTVDLILRENHLRWEKLDWPEPLSYVEEESLDIIVYAERMAQIEADMISLGSILVTDDVKAAMTAVLIGKTHILVDSGDEDHHLFAAFDDIANISTNCSSQNLLQTRVNSLAEAVQQARALLI